MITPLDKLIALAQVSIGHIAATPGSAAWEREMARVLQKAHTAAYMVGVAQRTGVEPRGLSRAERGDVQAKVKEQLQYLARFAKDAGDMSETAVRARAMLYAGALKPTYYESRWGQWDIPGDLLPGNQACIGRCLCTISVKDNEDGTGILTRVLGKGVSENHCSECPPLAGDHDVKRRAA